MDYTQVRIGRSFVLKFDHGEDFHAQMQLFCSRENIRAGFFHCIGAISNTTVVIGPRSKSLPPEPLTESIDAPHEVMGIGSIFLKKGHPSIHIHAVFSSKTGAFIGCIREAAEVFIVIEAHVTEFIGLAAERAHDPETGLDLLKIK
jgi:uncharacterized protein